MYLNNPKVKTDFTDHQISRSATLRYLNALAAEPECQPPPLKRFNLLAQEIRNKVTAAIEKWLQELTQNLIDTCRRRLAL